MRAVREILLGALLLISSPASGAEYDCAVSKKFDTEREYDARHLARFKFSIKIDEKQNGSFLSRCSITLSEGKESCDKYEVDKITYDEIAKIKKFYVFRSQFDIQIFPDMTFVENNGRGGIAFGTCKISSP
jgi:hypothetical protein